MNFLHQNHQLDVSKLVVQWVRFVPQYDLKVGDHYEVVTVERSFRDDPRAHPALYEQMPDGTVRWIADFGSEEDLRILFPEVKVD